MFDRNLLAARGRAQAWMIHRGALSLFGKYFREEGGGSERAVMPVPLRSSSLGSDGLKRSSRVGRETAGDDAGPLMSRYVCSSCSFVSLAGMQHDDSEERSLVVGVPGGHGEGRRSRWRWWRALIYRGNRSLFLSRRLSLPSAPPRDRYRLVIAFRYLNISAQ